MPFDEKDITSESVTTTGPAGADGAVGVPEVKWFAAIVNSRHEKAIADKLLKLNIEAYVATQKEMRLWQNGRRKLIARVVISSIVFIRCTEKERRQIVTLPYINRFMVNRAAKPDGLNRPVAVIRDADIKKLRFMLGQSEQPVEFSPAIFRVNDNVRVIRGNLRGLEGEIRKNSDGTHTLTVSLSLLGGAIVYIDPADVIKIEN